MSSKFELTDAEGTKKEFDRIEQLGGFLFDEAAAWERLRKDSNIDSGSLHRYFCHELLYEAASSIKKNIHKVDESGVPTIVGKVIHDLRHKWLWSGHSYLEEFVRYNRLYNAQVAEGFIHTVITELEESDVPVIGRIHGGTLEGQAMALAFLKNQEFRNKFQDFLDNGRVKIHELEDTYEEKLRLEKPAEYWKRAGKKFRCQAHGWSTVLCISLAIGIALFAVFFWYWTKGQKIPIKFDTIQGVVIFSTVLALYAFLIRTFSRLAFSAFHLMRDAEEREQLTYLYLSLTKEKVIDETSRNLILQALFSRSETGLLAGESGPSMPVAHEMKDLSSR